MPGASHVRNSPDYVSRIRSRQHRGGVGLPPAWAPCLCSSRCLEGPRGPSTVTTIPRCPRRRCCLREDNGGLLTALAILALLDVLGQRPVTQTVAWRRRQNVELDDGDKQMLLLHHQVTIYPYGSRPPRGRRLRLRDGSHEGDRPPRARLARSDRP